MVMTSMVMMTVHGRRGRRPCASEIAPRRSYENRRGIIALHGEGHGAPDRIERVVLRLRERAQRGELDAKADVAVLLGEPRRAVGVVGHHIMVPGVVPGVAAGRR